MPVRRVLVEIRRDPCTFPLRILQAAVSRNCQTQGRGRELSETTERCKVAMPSEAVGPREAVEWSEGPLVQYCMCVRAAHVCKFD